MDSTETITETIITRAEGFIELGMGEEAYNLLEDLPTEAKSTPQVYLLQLQILVQGGHWEKAEILGTSLVPLMPGDPALWLCLAKAHAGTGNLEAARAAVSVVSRLAPEWRIELLTDKQFELLW